MKWIRGNRYHARRKSDRRKGYYVDLYSWRIFFVILGLVGLSVTDAVLTLYLISHGAAEINPVMNYFLQHGPLVFFLVKYALTASAALLLLVNKNLFIFRTRFQAKHLYTVFLVLFVLVIFWEIYLIWFVLP